MKKRRNIRSAVEPADAILGFICLSGMLISAFLFWQDWNISLAKLNEKPIAFIYFKYNTAQRRLVNRNLWEQLRQASPIYDGDRIRTANFSEAVTVFNDGSRVDLHENTLIQVFRNRNDNSVAFINGAISVASSTKKSGLKVQAGGKSINFAAGTAAAVSAAADIAEPKKNNTVVAVTSGSVQIADLAVSEKTADTKQPVITEGNVYSFTAENPAAVQKVSDEPKSVEEPVEKESAVPVQMQKPAVDLQVYIPGSSCTVLRQVDGTASVSYFWKSSEPVRLQFARNAQFDTILSEQTLPADQTRSSIPLDFAQAEDTVFWRAIPADNGSGTADTGTLYPSGVIFIEKPVVQTVRTVASSVLDAKTAEIVAQAVQEPSAKAAVPEAVTVPATAVPSVVEEKKSEPVPVPAIETAVKAVPEKKTEPSAPKPKPAEILPPIVSAVPGLISPVPGKVFTDADFSADAPQIDFKWKPVKTASSYVFVLHKGGAAGKQLLSVTVKEPAFALKGDDIALLDDGSFTWTVMAKNTVKGKPYESQMASAGFKVSLSTLSNVQIDTSKLLKAR